LEVTEFYANLNGWFSDMTLDGSGAGIDRSHAWRCSWSHIWSGSIAGARAEMLIPFPDMGTTSALCPVQREGYWERVFDAHSGHLVLNDRRNNTQLKYLLPKSNTIEYVFEDAVIFRQEH
jgi:hypothetical protein